MREHKIVRVKMSKNFSEEEALMNKMSADGWTVVSVSPDALTTISIHLLIAFSREI